MSGTPRKRGRPRKAPEEKQPEHKIRLKTDTLARWNRLKDPNQSHDEFARLLLDVFSGGRAEASPKYTMAERNLELATQDKLRKYKELLQGSTDVPFWDIMVITAGDEDQQRSYEQQIALKKERREIPTSVKYIVFSDPPGAKIGNGGATMHALEQLQLSVPSEQLEKANVLLIHAGGYSQRLPHVSVAGKIFMAMPCGDPMFQMLEIMLILYIDLPPRMRPGVYLAAADIIFLFNGAGSWNLMEPGITAIGHPAPVEMARNHGVYVLEEGGALWRKYLKSPSTPTLMSGVRYFLHKLTSEKLKEAGAIIPGTNKVYVDLAYYMDYNTVRKLSKFYSKNKPLTCEIDAYGDFLQALGPEATPDYCKNVANVTVATDGLVQMRERVFQLLRGTNFRVVVFHEAQFNHVGTTGEYLHHLCYNQTLMKAFQFSPEVMLSDAREQKSQACDGEQEPEAKRVRASGFVGCSVMHSVLTDKDSISVGAGSVVEYCILEPGVQIGSDCIISALHLPANSEVPDEAYLHTVAVEVDGKTQYTTFAFDTGDSMKADRPREKAADLEYCQLTMETAVQKLGYSSSGMDSVWPQECAKCSLWTAKLFPVFATRLASSQYAVNMIRTLRGLQEHTDESVPGSLLRYSIADLLTVKSIPALLGYQTDLRTRILQ